MKTQILKSIFLFCILHFVFCNPSIAQIVYTDLVPDQTFNTDSALFHLDFDNNGTTDFDIQIHTLASTHSRAEIFLVSFNGNFVSSTNNFASALSFGTSINFTNTWINVIRYMERDFWFQDWGHGLWHHSIMGNWLNKTDEYLGFQFSSGGNTYFGWARLDTHINSNGTADFTIKDYAYNATANQSILAGDTSTVSAGISHNNILPGNFSVYPNPADNYFRIDLPTTTKYIDVTIADNQGKIIYTTAAFETKKIEVNISDFTEGIYYINIQTSEFIETRKLIVTKQF